MFIDTHCHLDIKDYENIEEVIKKMDSNIIIASSVDLESSYHVIDLCKKYDNVYGTIGFHPTELKDFNDENLMKLEELLNNKKIVGIGEIGLDYHYTKDDKELQIIAFKKQIELALKYKLPIVIHSRDAALDTMNIVKEYNDLKFHFHCFSYSLEIANEIIKLGGKIGIGGVITFKNSVKLRDIVNNIDLSNILLETDSPYLTPEPFRGKKNEPSNVKYVLKKIAEIKNLSEEEVAKITTMNAISQFDLQV